MRRSWWIGIGVLCALLAAGRARAEEWRPVPIFGGDVRTLAVDPEDPDFVLAGTSAGQVYLSRDGGRSWGNSGSALPFPGWVVGALRFDPNVSGKEGPRLWVALWGIWGSGHVAFSDDLGKSWVARAAGLPDEPVYTLALVPGEPDRLYAGTLSGVWGSRDAGEHWRRLTGDLPEMQKVTSLLVDSGQPGTVIAGTWRQAYRSDDGGATWRGVFDGMVLDSEVFSLTPIPGKDGEIWASTCGWVYRTLDRGGKWERFKDGFTERRTPSFHALPDGRLLAGTVAGLHLSEDGGKTWKLASDPALSVLAIASHPARPGRVILGTEGSGVWLSTDGASSFHRASRGMTNLRVAALARAGDDLLVAVNHAGPISGIHVSHDRGRSFDGEFSPVPPVLGFAVQGERAFAATERGLYERRGADWHRLPELGEGRVEQVVADGDRVVARTATALFERVDGKFVERPYKHGPPRSAALFGDSLWVSDGQGVYRLTADRNHTVTSPFAGRLDRLADRLLLSGPGGAWAKDLAEPVWNRVADQPARALPTGDERYPAVLVVGDEVRLLERSRRTLRPLEVPFPARDLSAALILDGRLFLGTSGYGVLVRELEEPLPAGSSASP